MFKWYKDLTQEERAGANEVRWMLCLMGVTLLVGTWVLVSIIKQESTVSTVIEREYLILDEETGQIKEFKTTKYYWLGGAFATPTPTPTPTPSAPPNGPLAPDKPENPMWWECPNGDKIYVGKPNPDADMRAGLETLCNILSNKLTRAVNPRGGNNYE